MDATDLDITVVIPTIPPRRDMVHRAVFSAVSQTLSPAAIQVEVDLRKEGAGPTRDRALRKVQTPWVAFLDDDDEFLPHHLATLMAAAERDGADYVFSYYELWVNGSIQEDSVLGHFGRPFNPDEPHQTTITTLVRTDLAQSIGFRPPSEGATILGQTWGEDYSFTLGCVAAGASIIHVPERTWRWHHHYANTSGRPDQW